MSSSVRLAYAALICGGVSQNIQASAQIRTLQWPYGRNVATSDMLAMLNERKGTCNTKHALLKSLATGAGLADSADARNLRINARNTLGIVHVLEKHQLPYIPEAHCCLVHQDRRIDVSRNFDSRQSEAIVAFLLEEEITTEPDQRAQAALASSIYVAMAEPRHLLESDLDQLLRIR